MIRRWLVALVLALAVAGSLAAAQGRRGGRFGGTIPLATPESFDGAFHFCRLCVPRLARR